MFKALLKFVCAVAVIYYLWLAFFVVPEGVTQMVKKCYKDKYEYKAYCECVYQPLYEHNFLVANATISNLFGNKYSSSAMKFERKVEEQAQICKSQLPAGVRMGEAFVDWLIGKLK